MCMCIQTVDDRHVAFCDFRGGVGKIVCVTLAILAKGFLTFLKTIIIITDQYRILKPTVNKHGRHRQFLFRNGLF